MSFTLPADSDLSAVAIYNVLDTSYSGGMSPLNSETQNAAALQYVVDTAQAGGGGIILIPSIGTYKVQGPICIGASTSPNSTPLVFLGTAQGTADQPLLEQTEDGMDLFYLDTATGEDNDIGGMVFQNLQIQYKKNSTSGTAIHVAHGQNVRIISCVFYDCPQAAAFDDTLQCSMFECTAQYSGSGGVAPNPACVSLGTDISGMISKETYIASCTLLSNGMGGVGLLLQGTEHVRVMNCRIEAFYNGIQIIPGAQVSGGHNAVRHYFGDVTVYAGANPESLPDTVGTAVIIQPQGPQSISDVVFEGCEFQPGDSSSQSIGPGVFIDETEFGGTIDTVRFVSCLCNRFTGPGIEITSGANIEILGGMYAGNNDTKETGTMSYGIAVTGPAVNVRIIGVSCIGSYRFITNQDNSQSPTQDVGIYVAGASNVVIDHCDLTANAQYAVSVGGSSSVTESVFIRNCSMIGYSGNPIQFGSNLSTVEVSSCSGYNDQGAAVATTPPASNSNFNGITYGYYGSVSFTVSGGGTSQIAIDGHNTNLNGGTFVLGPEDTAKISYSGLPTFIMIGQ